MIGGIIDVHHHFLPPRYVAALEAAGRLLPDGMPATPRWSEDETLATMDRLGIVKRIFRFRLRVTRLLTHPRSRAG